MICGEHNSTQHNRIGLPEGGDEARPVIRSLGPRGANNEIDRKVVFCFGGVSAGKEVVYIVYNIESGPA